MLKLATKLRPAAHAFETAFQSGFQFAELWLDHDILVDWRSVAETAKAYRLTYALHFPNRGALNEQTLENVVELYRALECRSMVIHQPLIDKFGGQLEALDASVRLAVENHRLTRDQFGEWAERNRWLTLDIEHLWMLTLEDAPLTELVDYLDRFLSRYGHKVAHVHLPGYLPGHPEHRPMYCSRDMVFAAWTLLDRAGIEGLIVSEVNAEFQNSNDLQMDRLLFETWCAGDSGDESHDELPLRA
jgi:hypothetical protein